ncbi:hypothetical protein GGE67_004074 [Rhizobium leucaenae]|uniref:Uncharacterized protein n=1 Tax=Rhizobium leucaenae TaxID=29450 RepID=A0A7W7EM48_9HYPH|nr:hypothetical protein [Rhizobium leucaenae]MBB6303442.1 hypothetical protein [Rhizobium leucaenae]
MDGSTTLSYENAKGEIIHEITCLRSHSAFGYIRGRC